MPQSGGGHIVYLPSYVRPCVPQCGGGHIVLPSVICTSECATKWRRAYSFTFRHMYVRVCHKVEEGIQFYLPSYVRLCVPQSGGGHIVFTFRRIYVHMCHKVEEGV